MALVLDKDELFRYLRGEITIEEWRQGREVSLYYEKRKLDC